MSFNCSVVLKNIDRSCLNKSTGGIKKVVIGLKKDLSVSLDTFEENVLISLNLTSHVVFEHNPKDKATYFSESKVVQQGNQVVNTDILVRIPAVDKRLNKIYQMGNRDDLICILYHNNGTITTSGWVVGLGMDYSASSGTSVSELSRVDISLVGQSWESSLSTSDESKILLGNIWENQINTWNNTNRNWI